MVFQDLFNGSPIQIGKEHNGLYTCVLNVDSTDADIVALNVCLSPYNLWHRRLGHVSESVFKKIIGLNRICHNKNIHHCDICPKAKYTRLPFPDSSSRVDSPFALLHIDVWGPFHIQIHDNKPFFLTIVDNFTRSTWVYLMQFKSDALLVLKNFISLVKNQFNTSVKMIRTDNGREFGNKESIFLLAKG